MSTARALAELNAMTEDGMAWIRNTDTGDERMEIGDLEIRVTKARLNHGFEWSLLNQGQVVLQGQWCEMRTEAKAAAVAFAKKWMVDAIHM